MSIVGEIWKSPWTRWVGFRYLKSKKNSSFLSLITLISVVGVGLGVTAMIVVLSVMDGFEAELKKRLMQTDLHVLITPTTEVQGYEQGLVPSHALDDSGAAEYLKQNKNVSAFWPILSAEVIIRSGKKVTGAVFKGITPERMNLMSQQLVESAPPQLLVEHNGPDEVRLPGLIIGQEFAYEMQLTPGDQVTVISPIETEGPMSTVPRLKRFVVEAIYHSGLPEQELHTVFAKDSAVRSFLRKSDGFTHWEITTKNFEHAPAIASELAKKLPQFRVKDWEQMNAHLFYSLKLERVAMFVILAFIIVVASFNIVTTLTLMVLEKKKEIAILKTIGAKNSHVGAIFLAEGLFIGGLGVGGGLLLGFLLCGALRRYDFIQLPEVYYDRNLPVTFDPKYYLLVGFSAVVIVLFACLYPSSRASKIEPLEGIRFG